MTALTDFTNSGKNTPQTEKARDDQVENNAGGFVFDTGVWMHFQRFLVLGTEGGTFYAGQKAHTVQAVESLKAAAKEDGIRAVDLVTEISVSGRGIKNDQAIFSLAYLASVDDDKVRAYALSKVNDVCRIGTHLFQFADFVQNFRGWGRGLRNAISGWYLDKSTDQLAYQVAKYGQRNGWSHRDLLRLSHPVINNDIAKFVTHPDDFVVSADTPAIIEGYIRVREAKTADEVANTIRQYNLTHDMIPTEFKGKAEVWNALLDVGIPYNALVRNLGVMSKNEVLKPLGGRTSEVAEMLKNTTKVEKSRIHPFAVLVAKATYDNGGGYRSQNSWNTVPQISAALDDAYYAAFGNVVPANKRTFIAIDVSGSMGVPFGDSPLTCSQAAAAFSMVTVRTEPETYVRGFDRQLVDIKLTAKSSLTEAYKACSPYNFGGTDCAKPMVDAQKQGLEVDTFVVVTDNETWAGNPHPFQALKNYRKSSGIDAKLVVVGMTATKFSIADSSDGGMLDVVGFDTAAPQVISNFSAGNV
jgi:60 kDa SS-A/Ro ribonucleoprotein